MKILIATAVAGTLAFGAGAPLTAYAQEGPPPARYGQQQQYDGYGQQRYENGQRDIRVLKPANLSHQAVARVQERLARDGDYRGPINGYWTAASINALRNFQARHGLRDTGELTTPTLMALNLHPHHLRNEGYPAG